MLFETIRQPWPPPNKKAEIRFALYIGHSLTPRLSQSLRLVAFQSHLAMGLTLIKLTYPKTVKNKCQIILLRRIRRPHFLSHFLSKPAVLLSCNHGTILRHSCLLVGSAAHGKKASESCRPLARAGNYRFGGENVRYEMDSRRRNTP